MAGRAKRAAARAPEAIGGPWSLPDGWRWERLGDILPLSYGKALPSKERDNGGSVPVYGSSGIVGSHSTALITGPVIIVGRKGSAGSVHLSEVACWPIDTAYFACPRQDIDTRFAFHLLSFQRLDALDQSTAIPSLSRDNYSELLAPVPGTPEQRRIAARIDLLFEEVIDGERALAEARASLNTYRASLLNAAVTGELTAEWRRNNPPTETGADLLRRILADRRARWEANPRNRKRRYKEPSAVDAEALPEIPDGWAWATLEQIAYVSGGATVDKKRKPEEPLEVPYLRVANVQRGHLDLSTVKQITIEASALDALQLSDGDILLNEGGDRDKVGRGWVWRNELPLCIHQNHVFKARPASEIVRPEFVSAYLNEMGRRFFIEESKQTTNLASISLTKISRAPVPIPPPAETDAILRLLSTLQAPLDYDLMDAATSASATLRQSILSAAFRGELI